MGRIAKHNSTFLIVGLVCCIAVGALFYFHTASATPYTVADYGGSVGLTSTDLKTVVINVIKWILGILALVAVVLIIYGGIIWMTAAGNVQRIEKAKRIIIDAVIGLVVVLISWAIVTFVVAKILGVTGGGGTHTTPFDCTQNPTDPRCQSDETIGLQIRSITTDCENATAGDYRHGVYLCSAVNITFNHVLYGQTVEDAVNAASMVIEQCNDENCSSPVVIADGSALDGYPSDDTRNSQKFVDSSLTTFTDEIKMGASWAARKDQTGKNITFFHVPQLYERNTWYRVTIPKTIQDVEANTLSGCRASNSAMTDLAGCEDMGTYYTWTMQTGVNVDTTEPTVVSSYPSSAYIGTTSGAQPDRSVPRTPLISVRYGEAVLPPTSVELVPYDTNDTPTAANGWSGGTLQAAVDPTTYTVTPGDDGKSFIIKMNDGVMLNEYTWYRVRVNGVSDLCNNIQDPEPFEWVFETNNVVPGIADEYPRNSYENACPSTPVFVRYTVSMFDPDTSSCAVNPLLANGSSNGGYVVSPYFFLPNTGKSFTVEDDWLGSGFEPNDYCKVYSFSESDLTPNTTYTIGIDNRYALDDQGNTLQFGTIPEGTAGARWIGDKGTGSHVGWTFEVKEPGQCADPPVITSIQPPRGTDGQCVTVNGYNFDPNDNGQAEGDDLLYNHMSINTGVTLPDDSNIMSWSDRQIPATMPESGDDGTDIPVNVTARNADPFGLLTSPDGVMWYKEAGAASNGPCLSSLVPSSGINGSQFTAKGKRLNPSSSTKLVNFGTYALTALNWKDDAAEGIAVPADAPTNTSYPVSVTNDTGTSNALNFTVNPVPPGQPIVNDYQPRCAQSCLAADITASFNYPIDVGTLTATNLHVRPCTDGQACTTLGSDLNVTISVDATPAYKVWMRPTSTLNTGSWYRVVVSGALKGTEPGHDGQLGGLNYNASGGGNNDSFSWVFKTTTAGAEGCALDRVAVSPKNYTMHTDGEQKVYAAGAYTEPNSCSASGQEITTAPGMSWGAWSTPVHDPPYATVAGGATPWTAVVTAQEQTVPDTTTVDVTATYQGVTESGRGILTIDFAYCLSDEDCIKNGCDGSICELVSHRCTPYIKSFTPDTGAIGTWVGISGCYFDGYRRGACVDERVGTPCDSDNDCGAAGHCSGGSAILFTDARRSLWPDAARCGAASTQWTPTYVKAEVPNKSRPAEQATDGRITIQRWDGVTAQSADDLTGIYTVDPTVIVPGICKLNPTMGSETTSVRIIGQNFGDTKGTSRVMYYDGADDPTEATTTAWSNTEIVSVAPIGIANNVNDTYEYPALTFWERKEVIVQNGTSSEWSNVENFDVKPPGCNACIDDSSCEVGQGCGSNGCCGPIPHVTATNPADGATNVCRNALISATFDIPMSGGTMSASTVHFYKEVASTINPSKMDKYEVPGVNISYDGVTNKMTVNAGLLDRNTKYTALLGTLGATNVVNGTFENFTGTIPDGWMSPPYGVAQSGDTATGSGHSVALDGMVTQVTSVSNGTAYAEQNVGTVSNQVRTYRLTARVKYEWAGGSTISGTGRGGIITRCWGPDAYIKGGTCNSLDQITPSDGGFDQYSLALRSASNPTGGLFQKDSAGQGVWHDVDMLVTNTSGKTIGPDILCFAKAGARVWCDDVQLTEVSSTGVKSAEGVSLQTTQWSFTTADLDGPCQVSRVEIQPSTWTFYTSDLTKPQSKKTFKAIPYSDTGAVLSKIPGVLDWTWSWSTGGSTSISMETKCDTDSPTPGAVCISDAQCNGGACVAKSPGNVDTATIQAQPSKGRAILSATVNPITTSRCIGGSEEGSVCSASNPCDGGGTCTKGPFGQTKKVRGTASINVTACNNPWQPQSEDQYGYTDTDSNCTIGSNCTNYHFDLGYCKDGDLPDLAASAITQYTPTNTMPALLKEYLFKEPNEETKDAIGIRIYNNLEGLSAAEWYAKYASNPKPSTLPQTVDGYDAVRDGTAVYIGASDFDGSAISSKIFIISYTGGADAKVVSIFSLLLEGWFFNNNVAGDCDPSAADESIVTNKVCIQHDLKRIAGLSDIVQYLRTYRAANGTYPKLEAGSYIAQLSFSAWPLSWQQTLGGVLGKTLPVDPVNKIENCPSSQSQDGTCWSESAKTFICTNDPHASHVYGYTSKTCSGGSRDRSACTTADQCPGGTCMVGALAKLYANLEYAGTGSWINNPDDLSTLCPTGSTCSCFNYHFEP